MCRTWEVPILLVHREGAVEVPGSCHGLSICGELLTVTTYDDGGLTHRRYTVRPTAVPIRAALNAVEIREPASVLRRLGGGRSTET